MHGSTRRMLSALAIACAMPLLSPLFAGGSVGPDYDPHASFRETSSCVRCHPATGGKPDPGRLLPGSVDFCLGCHSDGSLGRSHPVGGRPRDRRGTMKVPAEFRLDVEGRMTCLACHFAHGPFLSTTRAYPGQKPENPDAAAGTPPYFKTGFLRRTDPVKGFAVLCDGCHGTR